MADRLSLPNAAKQVAEIAGLEWAQVQPFYRALQEPAGDELIAWLPKSVGRKIWPARPQFIAPLLIALAAAGHPARSHETVDWVFKLTPNGRKHHLEELPAAHVQPPVMLELTRYLSDPAAARDLENVEFQQDQLRVVFNTKTSGQSMFGFHVSLDKQHGFKRPKCPGIYSRGGIAGFVVQRIAEAVEWATPDQAPYWPGASSQSDDEA